MAHSFVIARGEAPKQSRRAEILRYAQDDRVENGIASPLAQHPHLNPLQSRERRLLRYAQGFHLRIQAGKLGYQELDS
ncbi:MAG: hypothetical protein WBE46_01345 [Dehalococcoidia bacterium]